MNKLPYFFDNKVERLVIGTCLIDKTCISFFRGRGMKPQWFHHTNLKLLWCSMCELDDKGVDIDIVSVTLDIVEKGHGDKVPAFEIAEIASDVTTSAQAEYWHSQLVEQVKLRRLFHLNTKFEGLLREQPADSEFLLGYLNESIENVMDSVEDDPESLEDIYHKMIRQMVNMDEVMKLNTGLSSLDEFIGPLYGSDMTIVAGESSIGKTAFVMGVLKHINHYLDVPVLLFSLEMDRIITAMRCLSSDSHIRLTDIREGRADVTALMDRIEQSSSRNFFVECNTWAMEAIEAKTKYMVRKHGIGAMAVDYIQLADMSLNAQSNREQMVSMIGRTCKKIAKDNGIHVFALSQLDEAWGGRYNDSQKPTGRNLRESKALKHHTDNLLILYKDKKDARRVNVNIDKARNNAQGERSLGFIGSQTRFVNSPSEVPREQRR